MSARTRSTETIEVFALKYGLLQFLTAVDAVDHDGIDPAKAILIVMERRSDIGVLHEVPWAEVHTVDDIVKGPLAFRRLVRQRRYRRAVRTAIGGRSVRRLYLGHYSIETAAVARSVTADSVTVLDDGTSTAYRTEERAADLGAGRDSPLPPWKAWAKRLAGVDPRHLRSVRFFTVFRPTLTQGDSHDPCGLDVFRRRVAASNADPDLLWLLGTNMVELGHLDRGWYLELVTAIVERFRERRPSGRVEYHPHPREAQDKLDELVSRSGVSVVRSPDPVELRYLVADPVPDAGIVSFPSSALVTLDKLMPSEAELSMVHIADRVTWGPIATAEATVREHLGQRLSVVEPATLLTA